MTDLKMTDLDTAAKMDRVMDAAEDIADEHDLSFVVVICGTVDKSTYDTFVASYGLDTLTDGPYEPKQCLRAVLANMKDEMI